MHNFFVHCSPATPPLSLSCAECNPIQALTPVLLPPTVHLRRALIHQAIHFPLARNLRLQARLLLTVRFYFSVVIATSFFLLDKHIMSFGVFIHELPLALSPGLDSS